MTQTTLAGVGTTGTAGKPLPKIKMAAHRAWVAAKRQSLIERGKAAEFVIGYLLIATPKGGCSYHPLERIDAGVREGILNGEYAGVRLFVDKDSAADAPGFEEIALAGNTFDAAEGLVKTPVTLVAEKQSAWPGMKKKPGGLIPVAPKADPVPAAVVPVAVPEPTPPAADPEPAAEPAGLGGEADGRLELPPLAEAVPLPPAESDVIQAGDLPEPPAHTPTPGEPPAGWAEVEGGVVANEPETTADPAVMAGMLESVAEPDAPADEVDAVEREKAAVRAEMDAKIAASGGGAGETPPAAVNQPVVYFRKGKGGKYAAVKEGDDLTEGVVYRKVSDKPVRYAVVTLEELTDPAA